jgi:uncharacterized protein (TIGR03083 family)
MVGHASVRAVFDTIYDDARRRISELAVALSPEQLDSTVPATPEWTARQLVAHLTGVAADSVHGRREGAGSPAWTRTQVADREGRALDDVVAEWAQVAPGLRERIAQRSLPLRIVHDVLTHEADLLEAFGLGRLPADVVDAALPTVAKPVVQGVADRGVLVVRAGGHQWRSGEGEPDAEVTVEPYELYRGLISRRSSAQMRAWDWSGDRERYVDAPRAPTTSRFRGTSTATAVVACRGMLRPVER